ncbi:MAG: crotonase/enoyl-CoA hydratase family protein [Stellaceae bacterium]
MKSRSHLFDGALARLGFSAPPPHPSLVELAQRSPAPRPPSKTGAAIAALRLSEFDLQFDTEEKILWCYFDFSGRPCFTSAVLEQSRRIQTLVRTLAAEAAAEEPPVRYLVLASRAPGVWNLGGDLALFAELIRAGDRDGLTRYARACCEVGYTNATLYHLPIITVALVQGEALGGGFEAVLSSNVIVAERGARFGLPEILFNLFPGMGAYSFLSRRIAPGLAERMILSGEIYSAEQLHALGVVDILAGDGDGIDAIYAYVGRGGRRHRAHAAVRQARQIVQPIAFEEMTRIADLWVDAALKLTDADLRKMLRLAGAQDRRRARHLPAE